MIFAYDDRGVIMTDRVSCRKSVTVVYYCAFMQKLRRKMHKDRYQLHVAGILIIQDNARPHITDVVNKNLGVYVWEWLPHAPYSADRSPPDFIFFPKIKESIRGRWFSSMEDLSTDRTRAIRHMNRCSVLNGIIMLLKRWDSAIEDQETILKIVNR